MLHCAGLPVHSTTIDPDQNIEFAQSVGNFQRTLDEHAVGFIEEVLLQLSAIDRKIARSGSKNHTRRRGLSPARAQMLN